MTSGRNVAVSKFDMRTGWCGLSLPLPPSPFYFVIKGSRYNFFKEALKIVGLLIFVLHCACQAQYGKSRYVPFSASVLSCVKLCLLAV